MGCEWTVIVIAPFRRRFDARDCGDIGPAAERRFDFLYTHDRDTVVTAAQRFLQELENIPKLPPSV